MLSTQLNLWTPHGIRGCLGTMTSPAHVAVNFLKGQGREIYDKADVQGLTLLIRKGLTERCHILVGWEGCSRRPGLISRALSRDHQCKESFAVQSCPTLCDPMDRSTTGLPVHRQLQEFTQTHIHRVSDAIQPSHPCRPLLLLPSVFLSIRAFSNELAIHIRWLKYRSFSIGPSNEYSFRMDWLDLLAVQGTLKTLLQHHSFKSINSFGAQPSLWSNSHIHMWLLETRCDFS